jgi:tetratricopeptide (TPR) repeat protein
VERHRGGLLLTTAGQGLEGWLERGTNREEWERLRTALELAEGFVFFSVQTGDELAERYLGELLASFCQGEEWTLGELELAGATVTALLARLRQTAKPALFWIHRGAARVDAELDELFLLLNQKREVIAELADSPLVLALHPQVWARFRRYAPDFWSIHQTVARFSPGQAPRVRGGRAAAVPLSARRSLRELGPRRGPTTRASGWRVRASELARESLPRFYGRLSEVKFVVSTLASSGARLLISGRPGTGKTALLRFVVPRVADYYGEGIWWVSFANLAGDAQAKAETILARLLAELIPGAELPGTLAELSRMFRATTAEREALFIFEDLDDLTVADALVPGERASLVLTTALAVEAKILDQQLVLAGLGVEAGAELLQARTQLDAETARRVASAAGSLPSVLMLVAAILAAKPESAEAIIELLAGEAEGLRDADVEELLGVGVEGVLGTVSERARALWPRLSVVPGEFGAADAAALAGGELGEVERCLAELARVGLLEPIAGDESYRIHPLLLRLARRRLARGEGEREAQLAFARWVLVDRGEWVEDAKVRAAVAWIDAQRGEDGELPEDLEALVDEAVEAWLGAHSPNAVMTLGWELAQARDDAELAARICKWHADVVIERGEHAEARAWLERLLDFGERLGDPIARVGAYRGLLSLALEQGQLGEARRWAQTLLDSGHIDDADRLVLYRLMGDAHLPDYEAARAWYERALELSRTLGVPSAQAEACLRLSAVGLHTGDYEAAKSWAAQVLTLAEQAGHAGRAYEQLAVVTRAQEDFEAAKAWYDKALREAETAEELDRVGTLRLVLASLAWQRGDFEQIVPELLAARRAFEQAGSGQMLVDLTLLEIAGDAPEALEARLRQAWERAGLAWPSPREDEPEL